MNIAVVTGSPRKKDSYNVIKQIENEMAKHADVCFDYVQLSSCEILECKGCMQCFRKGEQFCPLEDDISGISKKLEAADAIIFASPVYAQQISGTMKRAIDRLSYMFHRPRLIAKPALTVVTTEGGGAKPTQKYLKMTASGWGCYIVGSLNVIAPFYLDSSEFYDISYALSLTSKIEKIASKFVLAIQRGKMPVPSFYDIYLFNGMRSKTYLSNADYDYWEEKGWLKSDYYYAAKLGPLKKLFGLTLNSIIKSMAKRYLKQIDHSNAADAQG